MKNILKFLLDRLTEDRFNCLYCDDEITPNKYGLCDKCFEILEKNNGARCPYCSRQVYLEDTPCDFCRDEHPKFDKAYAPLLYEGRCGVLIRRMKFYGGRYGYKYMVEFLLDETNGMEFDVVCPVPVYGKRTEKDLAFMLAKEYAKRRELPFEELLKKTKKTPKQHKLGKAERLKNLKNAFELKDKTAIRGRKILMIDDIMTTGATLSECATAIKKGKPESVTGLCLAVTTLKKE